MVALVLVGRIGVSLAHVFCRELPGTLSGDGTRVAVVHRMHHGVEHLFGASPHRGLIMGGVPERAAIALFDGASSGEK